MVEWEARCLALEQAYVHEVYYQMGGTEAGGGTRQTPPWPRVTHFLNQLEPGSIVCDVGCGSGKYLSINPSVFKVGVDRCSRLAETAREEDNEVLICDNLSLPFRDESFDAVLSIAVIHHFATTERRVGALKELARILRIGGRLVITVWAMEQRHRKFESQDVLVPWHRPQTVNSPSLELTPTTTTSEEESHHHPYTACTHTSDSDSAPSARASRGKRRSKHNEVMSSPSNSSLSSPNESCYSFVRRALKKLAGVKRGNPRGRPWFLDSWTSCSSSKEPPPRRYDPDGCEDIQDLPIELRRLEENSELPFRTPMLPIIQQVVDPPLNQKSKSLSDIITVDQKALVRSQSSFPNLEARDRSPKCEELFMNKPRLIKQNKSFCVEDIESEDRDEATDMKELIDSLPEFRSLGMGRKGNVFKQSSMNEELMSVERLREKERVRQNIQKQASLNEELIYSRNNRTLDSLRDTLFSTSTAKRLQLLKNGLTNKIKSSTTGIEKVAGVSIKNGFVRILQGWTGSEVTIQQSPQPPPPPPSTSNSELKSLKCEGKKEEPERRHSREDGSDSSKDSSLQSDTSVDSEDSFASVIFIPKADAQDQQSSTTSPTMQSNPASPQPTSPKIKFPPPISPKLKTNNQMSFGLPHPSSPKIKHPNQLISTSPSSPKVKYFPSSSSPKPFQTNYITTSTSRNSFKFQPSSGSSTPQVCKTAVAASKSLPPTYKIPHLTPTSPSKDPFKEISPTRKEETDSAPAESNNSSFLKDYVQSEEEALFVEIDLASSPRESPSAEETKSLGPPEPGPSAKSVTVNIEEEPPSQVKENTKPHKDVTHSKSYVRSQFPLVRRSSSVYGKGESGETLPVARLLSLEIFNPETDDMDSDSSGLSSPDSVGSVISIKNDDETVTDTSSEQKNIVKNEESVPGRTSGVGAEKYPQTENIDENKLKLKENKSQEVTSSPRLSPLLEAAVDVANTLEETVEAVIQSSPQAKRKNLPSKSDSLHYMQEQKVYFIDKSFEKMKEEALKEESSMLSPTTKKLIEVPRKLSLDIKEKDAKEVEEHRGKRWDEECRQHLADFAEKLSEKLLAEIDRYRELHSNIRPMSSGNSKIFSSAISRDPYLFKLNEDLNKLTRLSIELQEDVVPCRVRENVARVKAEGATVEEKHIESKRRLKDPVVKIELPDTCFVSTSSGKPCPFLEEEYRPLLEEFDSTNSLVASSNFSRSTAESLLSPDAEIQRERERRREEEYLHSYYRRAIVKEKLSETFEPDNLYIDETWAESRRNPVLPSKMFSSLHSIDASNRKEETTKIELLRAKDVPRRPSISIEMSESLEKLQKERDDLPSESQLHLGVSLESSEAGDISEKTGSSSDGSRPGSRRDTIHISHSGSVLSLRPGLSIESSEAGDISASDLSRRDILGQSDLTSSSQNSLLRPGNSIESSDAGDVSDRTGSDVSRQNTSSTGKTASAGSTASIASASDKASDCSKDARFADRRMARCDGRSSSEEMPTSKSSLNKLVRQRASTHEPPEILAKAQSCETSISGSTSQDSLLSDSGGGAITFHRYYHVFREGELDSLIERYVENLHIISSYYDHANWCIIAEKVQVWTI